jgi:phosphoenolpyruvate-protein kinase (PTS system EI component)
MDESLALDSYSDSDIEKLLEYGDNLVKDKKQDIKRVLKQIVDQVIRDEKKISCSNSSSSTKAL